MKVLAPLLQIELCSSSLATRQSWIKIRSVLAAPSVYMLHPVKIDKALVNRISKICWRFLADDADDPRCQVSIQFIVAAENGYLLVWALLCQFELRCPLLDSQRLGLVAAGYDTAVIVAQHHNRFALQVRTENPLTAHITVIAVNDAVHPLFPTLDCPNDHSPDPKTVWIINSEIRGLGVCRLQFDISVLLVCEV